MQNPAAEFAVTKQPRTVTSCSAPKRFCSNVFSTYRQRQSTDAAGGPLHAAGFGLKPRHERAMLFTLLPVTFLIATAVPVGVVHLFHSAIKPILTPIVADELASAWHRYIKFAACVVGISGGVRIYGLERYISVRNQDQTLLELNAETWVVEVY